MDLVQPLCDCAFLYRFYLQTQKSICWEKTVDWSFISYKLDCYFDILCFWHNGQGLCWWYRLNLWKSSNYSPRSKLLYNWTNYNELVHTLVGQPCRLHSRIYRIFWWSRTSSILLWTFYVFFPVYAVPKTISWLKRILDYKNCDKLCLDFHIDL